MTLLERYILGKKKERIKNNLKKRDSDKKVNVTMHIPEISDLIKHLNVVYSDIIAKQDNQKQVEPPVQEAYDVLGNLKITMSYYNTGD